MRNILLAMCALALPALAGDRPPDLNGTPNLIVDSKTLQNHWIVRDEDFSATACSVIEGDVQPGPHRVLRFTVSTPNVGTADIFIGDPNAHVAANDGLYEFASCHNHFHFRHYATYQLIGPDGHVWRAAKRGFCMIDVSPAPAADGAVKTWAYRNCGRVGIPGNQGISHGWADVYVWQLSGQYFVLDGGDGQAPVPPGTYTIRITVNPSFDAAPGERCPNSEAPPSKSCHQLPESNYADNVGEAVVVITDHPGKSGVGPGTNDQAPHDSDIHDDAGEPID
jgi:Lysyl oxidase